jgi:hypothetical protein
MVGKGKLVISLGKNNEIKFLYVLNANSNLLLSIGIFVNKYFGVLFNLLNVFLMDFQFNVVEK